MRFVNVTNLFALARPDAHPDGMSDEDFRALFTDDRPVIFNFHGYPSAVHQLIHRRPRQERFHVRGYAEEGTTTTPFDLLAMNGVDRFQLAIDAISRADISVSEIVRGMSGAFAVRIVPGASAAIEKFSARLAGSCATRSARRATTRRRSRTGCGRAADRRPHERAVLDRRRGGGRESTTCETGGHGSDRR